ncbi:primosomal protein N' [Lentisphaerota bacterium ZTH]|nr:primosomal protein N' [Lentisphaerota bacterium]WET07193.1 primosomal protein N' [Lentisphaerota bacterium ZTH]
MNVAKVIVDLSLDKAFDYNIPEELKGRVHIGVQVKVPFGRSSRRGYVLNIIEKSDFDSPLKDIHSICERHTRIPERLVKLGRWMADYYCCSREQAVRTLLPRAVRSGKVKHKTLKLFSVADTRKAEEFVIAHSDKKRYESQLNVLRTLLRHQEVSQEQLLSESGTTISPVKTLLKNGLISEEKRVVRRDPFADVTIIADQPQTPTAEQKIALDKIYAMLEDNSTKHTLLLHGVTSSGKTEVYLQAISRALENGREAIVLVPEIALTPQTVRRFRARFGDMVSVLHSRLTEGERFDEWSKINDGLVKIAVGARSALFAPFQKLGLIIVDEEHESSYKQGEAPRYHARDVAVLRGKMEDAVVILGSATPSFESYKNALDGKYELAELRKRVDDCLLPSVKVVDNRLGAYDGDRPSIFSKVLINEIRSRLERGEQTILFLNRRGFARQMMCEHCGYVAECPSCSVSYTYHKKRESLTCHLCGDVIRSYVRCPKCNAEDIRYSGSGTEKIEAIAAALFSKARIERMDSDTMRKASSYETVLNRFKRGEIDILIGTQMIAKGLHFPNVTLVGILNADQGLYIPDFRADERTFQLLTQVAGRAGRGDVRGEVVIQTFNPDNETIRCSVAQDFNAFFKYDMEMREALTYPPFGHLLAVHFRSEDQQVCMNYAEQFMQHIRPLCHEGVVITEPAPSPIERVKGKYRYMIILRGEKLKMLRQHIRRMILDTRHPKSLDIYVDVDAQSLL